MVSEWQAVDSGPRDGARSRTAPSLTISVHGARLPLYDRTSLLHARTLAPPQPRRPPLPWRWPLGGLLKHAGPGSAGGLAQPLISTRPWAGLGERGGRRAGCQGQE